MRGRRGVHRRRCGGEAGETLLDADGGGRLVGGEDAKKNGRLAEPTFLSPLLLLSCTVWLATWHILYHILY